MLHHVAIVVSDLEKAKAFYLAALAPLGYKLVMEFPDYCVAGLGADGKPDFWISAAKPDKPANKNVHVAFVAPSREIVDQFHAAATYVTFSVYLFCNSFLLSNSKAGGKDNGAAGPRPQYTPTYYAAFVHDEDGNNIEVVHM